jgi:hypothetical protein
VHRLRATAETWVPRHFPNGRREGDEWRLANIRGDPLNMVNVGERAKNDVHSGNAFQDRRDLASGERSERFSSSHAYARARAHTHTHTRAHVKEGPPERSQSSPRSQDQAKSEACAGERASERPSGRSQWPNPPDWLKEVL